MIEELFSEQTEGFVQLACFMKSYLEKVKEEYFQKKSPADWQKLQYASMSYLLRIISADIASSTHE